MKIDNGAARRMALAASISAVGPGSRKKGSKPAAASKDSVDSDAFAAISRLGSVQIDTISIVERAHNHVLWSRVPGYDRECIGRLESEPRRIIEYWSHAAAYIPLDEYRFCLPRMERVRAHGHDWFKADPAVAARVLDRVRAEGPLRAQDFSEPMRGPRGWWDWKPAKVALEYLFHAGFLVSVTRRGFQKVYDVAERALPAALDLRMPTPEEMAARHVDRAASALGIFALCDIAYLRKEGKEGIEDEIAHRVESGLLVELEIDSGEGKGGTARKRKDIVHYATPESLEAALSGMAAEKSRPSASVLSPFDPMIIDRKRTSRLFGFDYQIECYVPESKRKFGYFALPVMYADASRTPSFVGLADAKADRASGTLIVNRLDFGHGLREAASGMRGARKASEGRRIAAAAATALADLARFNGCASISVLRFDPEDPVAADTVKALRSPEGRKPEEAD